MKNIDKLRLAVLILLIYFTGITYAVPENVLSENDIEKLIIGKTLVGHHLKKDFSFIMYVKKNGTLSETRDGIPRLGEWYIDGQGKFCWGYNNNSGKMACRWIKRNGDGTYTKVKNSGKEVRNFKIANRNTKNP